MIGYVQTNSLFLAGSGVIVGAITATLTTFTDIYANVLTMAAFGSKGFITFEPDTTNEEAATFTGVTANANGTYTLTGLSTGLAQSPYTETSGLVRSHAGGTKVVVTDNVEFWNTFANQKNTAAISAIWTFGTGATPLITDQPTTNLMAANKLYVDTVTTAGAPDASSTTKGITKLSVNPVSPTSPIAVGTNDTRMPPASGTSGGVLGYTGTNTIASSTALTQHAIVIGGGAGATPTPLASLGTTTTVLHGNASSDPTFGAVNLATDVTGVLPNANGGAGGTTGIATYAGNTASGSQTIAHGLGRIPKFVRISVNGGGTYVVTGTNGGLQAAAYSYGVYDGTHVSCNYQGGSTQAGSVGAPGSSTTNIIAMTIINSFGGGSQVATITVDATNINLTWTYSNNSGNTIFAATNFNILWETQ